MATISRFEGQARIARREHRFGRRLGGLVHHLISRVLRWHDLARQRRALLQLDERLLKDIGITRNDAQREGLRPFWDDLGHIWDKVHQNNRR